MKRKIMERQAIVEEWKGGWRRMRRREEEAEEGGDLARKMVREREGRRMTEEDDR